MTNTKVLYKIITHSTVLQCHNAVNIQNGFDPAAEGSYQIIIQCTPSHDKVMFDTDGSNMKKIENKLRA